MKIYLINDQWDEKSRAYFEKRGTKLPGKQTPYTIRKVLLLKEHYFLLLNELENEFVNGSEDSFHYSRFTDVPDNVLSWDAVHEIYINQKTHLSGWNKIK